MTTQAVKFKINGEDYSVSQNVNPDTKLVDFLRKTVSLTGTKVMCREGGCGACIVTLITVDPSNGGKMAKAVNSCLLPILSCDGCEIITVEGIGNKKDGYHPVQSQLADLNGTQCGYCSSGMVMSMYSLLEKKNGTNISVKEVEQVIDGNICRCTGYRPIMDAFKTFAQDVPENLKSSCLDLEDIASKLRNKQCPKSGTQCTGHCKSGSSERVACSTDGLFHMGNWYRPSSMHDLQKLLRSLNDSIRYRLVAGNTGTGVFKHDGPYDCYIDINRMPELHTSSFQTPLTIGGGVSLATFQDILSAIYKQNQDYWYGSILADHIGKIASTAIRSNGSIAGNLMMKHQHNEFTSDLFIILETVAAEVIIMDCEGEKQQITMMDFLKMDMNRRLIIAIILPPLSSDGQIIKTYKIMPRTHFAHAYINAGFRMKICKENNVQILEKPSIVFGGINEHFIHAEQTEEYLTGKFLGDENVLRTALRILEEEIDPVEDPPNPSPEYRKSVARNLLYKFALIAMEDKASPKVRSAATDLERGISSGKQEFDTDSSMWPIHQPLLKVEARAQCSGEAQYVDDIPLRPGELHGAFVVSTVASCRIESIDASEALKAEGVVAFLDYKDIKTTNTFVYPEFDCLVGEEIFCSGQVLYAGQIIGLIVARTQMEAMRARNLVRVKYTDFNKPILNIKDAIQYPERVQLHSNFAPPDSFNIGNVEECLSSSELVVEGEIEIGSQYHMFMETHVALCIPTEDGMDVYCATQDTDSCQRAIANVLNIPKAKINIEVKRLGGSYGGKISRATVIAVACALAAAKTNRPVRIQLDLETNMTIMGGRLPYYCRYKAGVDGSGRLQAVDVDIYSDCGPNFNEGTAFLAATIVKNCYEVKAWKITPYIVRTDTPKNTYCRAPGTPQGIALIETIMEHIAKIRNEEPLSFRVNNFKSDHPLHKIVEQLKISSEYDKRRTQIEEFNLNNRWKKRGVSMVPMVYPVEYWPFHYNVLVAVYHHDGSVAVSHGGIETGQGINTKVAQVVAYELGIPVSFVTIKSTNTFTNPNGSVTGGSLTSELNCYAAMMACRELKERMRPIKEKNDQADWLTLVEECFNNNVDLSARHYFSIADNLKGYEVHGAAVTEVELDILTGEKLIRRVDLIEDAGQSLSPLVDIGQVEGAFVMGLGLWTSERIVYDPKTGKKLVTGTWDYKPPLNRDIPEDFRVTLLKNAAHPFGVLRSKATGEPPFCLSVSVLFALRAALESARSDIGYNGWFQLNGPATVDALQNSTLSNDSKYFQQLY